METAIVLRLKGKANSFQTWSESESESEYFTGDTSIDIHSPGSTIAKTLDLTSDLNLVTGSSELSAEEVIAAGSAFQSGRKNQRDLSIKTS